MTLQQQTLTIGCILAGYAGAALDGFGGFIAGICIFGSIAALVEAYVILPRHK